MKYFEISTFLVLQLVAVRWQSKIFCMNIACCAGTTKCLLSRAHESWGGEFLTKYITLQLDTNKLTTKNPIWKSQGNKLTVKTLQVSNLRYNDFPLYIWHSFSEILKKLAKQMECHHFRFEQNQNFWRRLNSTISSKLNLIHISYFYSTTKHEIIQIKNHNLLCSLDPPNQSRLF